jgi:hypothetical protein
LKKIDDRKHTAENIWLSYFNKTLYEQGFISETERNRMALKIDSRKKSVTHY